jgi:hypothetical protein
VVCVYQQKEGIGKYLEERCGYTDRGKGGSILVEERVSV